MEINSDSNTLHYRSLRPYITVEIRWREQENPKRLKTLACKVVFPNGNSLLHQFVVNNSHPNESVSENCINAVLRSMSDAPGDVVNTYNSDGFTALHLAVLKENFSMVRMLLSRLINIDVNLGCDYTDRETVINWGSTALHLATELGHLLIIQELLSQGAGIDERNINNETALFVAAKSGHSDVIKLLVSKGADVNAQNNFGSTSLHFAVHYRSDVISSFLKGSILGKIIDTPKLRIYKIAKRLLGKDADLRAIDEDGRTPLYDAVFERASEVASSSMHPRAEVGGIPRYAEEYRGYSRVIRTLLDRGADLNARNINGLTPHDLARNQLCIDILNDNIRNIKSKSKFPCLRNFLSRITPLYMRQKP